MGKNCLEFRYIGTLITISAAEGEAAVVFKEIDIKKRYIYSDYITWPDEERWESMDFVEWSSLHQNLSPYKTSSRGVYGRLKASATAL